MLRIVGLLLGMVAAAGCGESGPSKTSAELPNQVGEPGKGDWRTNAYTDFRGEVRVDDTFVDTYQPAGAALYQGYTLELEEGDIVDIRVAGLSSGFDAVAGLYGPQRRSGAWGNLIAANDDAPEGGTLNSHISFEAAKTGKYLVIVRDYSFEDGDFSLSVSCAGGTCEANQCKPLVCEEYCEFGHQLDYLGCEQCSCNPAPSCQWNNPPPYVRCAGIETYGKNPVDGTCCQYPSPCYIPEGYEHFATEGACLGLAAEGEGCSLYGTQCQNGLECQFVCPDGSTDGNCNLGINPTGTCVATAPAAECQTDADCVVTGCSGQMCAPEARFSTCEYRPEYACYGEPTTSCGCNNGSCGWDQTDALTACLAGN